MSVIAVAEQGVLTLTLARLAATQPASANPLVAGILFAGATMIMRCGAAQASGARPAHRAPGP